MTNKMKSKKMRTTYEISTGYGCNSMELSFHDDGDIGCIYSLAHWHKDIKSIVKSLREMADGLEDFKQSQEKK
jgi:hypothetical protein